MLSYFVMDRTFQPRLRYCWTLALAALGAASFAFAQVNVLTVNYDNQRSNSNLQETVLTQSNVTTATFGRIGSFPVDGQIYAQPLYVSGVEIGGKSRNVVYVVTMHNSVYAIDADAPQSKSSLWRVNLGPSVPSGLLSFTDIEPEVGILSTPVIDPVTQVMYVVADTLAEGATVPVFRLHALSLVDGHESMNGSVQIQASLPSHGAGNIAGTLAFNPLLHLQRAGLALANGKVYLGFGSHGDGGDFHGWLMCYDASNLQHQIGFLNTSPQGLGGSIWQAGRGPAIDTDGNLFVVTGNGNWDGEVNYSESALRVSGTDLTVLDWFTPWEWNTLNANDWDFGTTGPILVPNSDFMLTGSKEGKLYLIPRDSMGHLEPNGGGTVASLPVSEVPMFDMALWNGPSGLIAYLFEPFGGIKSYGIANGQFNPSMLSQYLPNSPWMFAGIAISSNGATAGTGIVWLTSAYYGTYNEPGALHALDPLDLSHELWNSDMVPARDPLGRQTKFVAPTVANGRVYVPTFSHVLAIYGLLENVQTPAVSVASVVNLSSFAGGGVSPGEMVTVFGSGIGPLAYYASQLDSSNHVAVTLGGANIYFDGISAPLIYASATEVGAIVPFGISGTTTQVQALYQGQASASISVPVIPATPAIIPQSAEQGGQGAILNQDGSMNTPSNPADRGSIVVLWATGLGQTSPPGQDGIILSGLPLPVPLLPVSVFIDNQPADVLYAGAAPGMVDGVMQINARIPMAASSRYDAPVVVQAGIYASPPNVWLAIR
jgi:uncharacterized protein (TIGR03437 family)